MTQVCDFSNQHINLTQVKAHFAGIISYVSDTTSKNLTSANFNGALAQGLTVTLVCEQAAQQALRGTAGGIHDSTIANQQADNLGYDKNAAIYYVAEDPSRLPITDWPTVVQYFEALEGRPKGAYGGLQLVTHLINLGLVTYGWVVQTWGGTNGQVHLEQMVGAPTYGLDVDVDTVLQPDYGQMPRPAPPNGGDVPAPTDVVDCFYPTLSTVIARFDLHADGGLFGYLVDDTLLNYVAIASDGSSFEFPNPAYPGVFSYPGLPASAKTIAPGAYFVRMSAISYNGVPVGGTGQPDLQPKLTAAAAGLSAAATALE